MTAERPPPGLDVDLGVLMRGGLLFLLLLAFAVRLPGLTAQSLWRDEVDALRFSQDSLGALLDNFSRAGWNGPLYYLLLRAWVALTGQTEFALRYLSLLLSVLGVAALYRLGRDWFYPLLGGVAALLMATSPYVVWYAQEVKMYALLSPLVLGLLYAYRRALESRDWRLWVVVVAGIWVLMGLHVMGVLLIPVLLVLLLPWWPLVRGASKARADQAGTAESGGGESSASRSDPGGLPWPLPEGVRRAAIGLGLGLLPALVALPWAWKMLWRGGNIGHDFVSLPNMVSTLLYAFGRGITTTGGLWPIGLVIFFVLAGSLLWPDAERLLNQALVALAGRRREIAEPAYVSALWIWLLVPVLGLLVISTRVPMFVDRYLIWIGPALLLLIARGYDQLRKRMAFLATLCLVSLLLLNGWAVLQQSTTPIKSDFRGAAAYLRAERRTDELILFHISYVRDTFEYYFGPVLTAADGIPTNEKTTVESVDQAMRAQIGAHRTVWLVLSEPEMWDARGMTVAWLDAHARADLRANFARVTVVRYRFD
jgi:uncharacterized membrane protein